MLLGPVQSLTYALNYGWPSAALGASWARRLPWQLAVGFGVLARVAGVSGYVALTSWTLGENFILGFFLLIVGFLDVFPLFSFSCALKVASFDPPLFAASNGSFLENFRD